VRRHFSFLKSKTVPFGQDCIRGPQETHMKNLVQLNGNGAMSPSAQPVGIGGKSQVAVDEADVANVVAAFAGPPWTPVGSKGFRMIGCWLYFAFALAVAGRDAVRRKRQTELNEN
jgi:hypothetical protein